MCCLRQIYLKFTTFKNGGKEFLRLVDKLILILIVPRFNLYNLAASLDLYYFDKYQTNETVRELSLEPSENFFVALQETGVHRI